MYSLRIITFNSTGLLNDAETYKQIFSLYNIKTDIYIFNDVNKFTNIELSNNYDINLFLEHIPNNINDIKNSICLFMPNYELFNDLSFSNIKHIDYVLCKTEVTYKSFNFLIKKYKFLKYKCIYTKFTTKINDNIKKKQINKNPNLFTSFAGKSFFKNIHYLVYCWLKNNGFIKYDKNIQLHITCYDMCYDKMLKYSKNFLKVDLLKKYKFINHDGYIQCNNLYIYTNKLNKNKSNIYNNLLMNSSLSICISEQEGYGHYLNEALYFKTPVITLNSPPMNEIIKDNKNGFLLKNNRKILSHIKYYKVYKVYPNLNELRDKIIYCIKNKSKLIDYGLKGKEIFINNTKFFIKKMTLFISYLIKHNLTK